MRILLLALVFASPLMTQVHAAAFTAQDLVTMERVADPQLAPDGKRVAYTLRRTELEANKVTRQIWLLDIASARTRQLTGGSGQSHTPRWGADGQLYFLSTRSGSSQVWRLDSAGGEAEAVTSLPLDVQGFVLAPGVNRIALALEVFPECGADLDCTRARLREQEQNKGAGVLHERLFVRHWDQWKNGTRAQLFVATLKDGQAGTPVWLSRGLDGDAPTKPFGDDQEITFTPDGAAVIFTLRVAGSSEAWSTNLDLWRVAADGSGAPENLTADNPGSDSHPRVTPDGRQLVWLSQRRADYESDRRRILVRDLQTGATRELAAGWDRSPQTLALSTDSRSLYVTADDLGQTPLFAIHLTSGIVRKLTGPGTVSAFSATTAGVVYAQNRLDAPDDLYLLRWSGGTRRLSTHNAERLKGIGMGSAEPFQFAGWNDEPVHAYVVKPPGLKAGQKAPLALIIHGGPQASMGNDFHYRWNPQVYAGRGYAVLAIDFHGSTGYGQAFTDSISRDWGGKPLVDIQKGLAHALAKYSWIDGTRVCALGASYGGYMINWIAGNWPQPFRCLVNHDGVYDLRSMATTTDELWFTEWEIGGTPWDKPQNYEAFNPANHVDKWQTPMLVIHGAQDFRVPVEQSLATFTALQRRGVPSQFLVFPQENHWVLDPRNSLQWHEAVLGWLDRWTAAKVP